MDFVWSFNIQMRDFIFIVLCIFMSGCSTEIIHFEHLGTLNTYVISEVKSPPWVKLVLTDPNTNDKVAVHLQKHCYRYKQIPIGLRFYVNKTEVTYSDYSTEIKIYPDYEQKQNIIYKYCN